MKLFYAPGACSLGIHVLLEEIGKPYETAVVKFAEGAQYKPDFTAINPKSKVPTLVRDDGSVLTEFPAIAYWLARTNPQAKLLPDDPDTMRACWRRWTMWSPPCTCRASRACSAPRTSRPTPKMPRR